MSPRVPLLSALPLLALVLLAGCFGKPQLSQKVQEPPYVPAPVATESASGVLIEMPVTDVRVYADMALLEDRSRYPASLRDAVSRGIAIGVLRPTRLDETFDPDRPLTYGEFRAWTLAYQSALLGYGMVPTGGAEMPTLPQANAKPGEARSKEAGSKEIDALKAGMKKLTSPMSPEKLMVLPVEMGWEGHMLAEKRPLTREELCALYVFLSKQEDKARALSREEIEGMNPSGDAMNMDESLSQFKDYTALGQWSQKYVALAYKDGLLQNLFRLTPNRLTVDDGFSPSRPVSRADGMVLLHHLYGRLPVQTAQTDVVSKPTDSSNKLPVSSTVKVPSASDKAGQPALGVQPVGRVQAVRESGPGFSRQALRVSGPE